MQTAYTYVMSPLAVVYMLCKVYAAIYRSGSNKSVRCCSIESSEMSYFEIVYMLAVCTYVNL